jgi:hypothetical protein
VAPPSHPLDLVYAMEPMDQISRQDAPSSSQSRLYRHPEAQRRHVSCRSMAEKCASLDETFASGGSHDRTLGRKIKVNPRGLDGCENFTIIHLTHGRVTGSPARRGPQSPKITPLGGKSNYPQEDMVMKGLVKVLMVLSLAAVICMPVTASALLVTFDDLSTPNNSGGSLWGLVPQNYLGWTWTSNSPGNGWEVQENSTFKSVYNNSGDFPSLPNAAYNDTGASVMTISFGRTLDVVSAYFRSFGQNDQFQNFSAQSVTLKGYTGGTGGTLLYTLPVNLSPAGMVLTSINFTGVDTITFTTDSGRWWLMDNMEVVPLPPSLLLLGSGLLGLGCLRWRKTKNSLAA